MYMLYTILEYNTNLAIYMFFQTYNTASYNIHKKAYTSDEVNKLASIVYD